MRATGREVGTWGWAEAAVACGAGFGLGWSFVDFRYWLLPWVAVAPLIALAETATPRRAFLRGWLAGVVGIACAFAWLVYAFQVFGGFALPTALALFVAPVGWMGLQIGCFCGLLAWLGPLQLGLAAPLTFTVVEFLFPTLFPWRIAHTQWTVVLLLQSGEIAGPYLLGFAMVWVNAGLVRVVRDRDPRPLVAALVLVATLVVAGHWRMAAIEAARASAPLLRVGVVQGNIGVERKGDRTFFRRNLEDYRRLSRDLAADVDLLVWPETVAQHPIDARVRLPPEDEHPFPSPPRPLVFGGLAIGDGPEGRRLYNSAFLTDRQGAILGRYDKRILVPFGEYLPFATRFPWLRRVSPATGRFSPGDEPTVLVTDDGVRLGPLICYEDVIPGPAREAVRRGALLLLNLTNDAWYGESAEPYQHQALALWRAIEMRRDFIRATNTGLTAAISATGAILAELPIFVAAGQQIDVRLLRTSTFYAAWGDVFAWAMVLTWLLAAWNAERGMAREGKLQTNRDAALKTPAS
jgi:apolipoprotein N-acyltransferase